MKIHFLPNETCLHYGCDESASRKGRCGRHYKVYRTRQLEQAMREARMGAKILFALILSRKLKLIP